MCIRDSLNSISANDCDLSHFNPVSLPALTTLSLENNALMDLEIGDNYPCLLYTSHLDGSVETLRSFDYLDYKSRMD